MVALNISLRGANTYGVTEFRLFSPCLSAEHFVRDNVNSLWKDILGKTQSRVVNLDDMVAQAFFTDTSSVVVKYGLYEIISNALTNNDKKVVQVEVVNNSIIFTNVNNYNVIDDPDNSILVIDGTNAKTKLFKDWYFLIYEYIIFVNQALKLANKPIIQLNEMRSQNTGIAINAIQNQVEDAISQLKSPNGIMILDSKDLVTTISIDAKKYETILKDAYKGIANTLKVPMSFVTGEYEGGLSNNDNQEQSVEDMLGTFYGTVYQPILRRIYEIIGKQFDAIYPQYKVAKLRSVAPILKAVELSNLLNQEQKSKILAELLGVDFKHDD